MSIAIKEFDISEYTPVEIEEETEPEVVVENAGAVVIVKGKDGKDGEPGKDGFSPDIEVEKTEDGHKVTITDKDGEEIFEIPNGGGGSGGEVTAESIENALGYPPAKPSDIPTKTSQLENDEEFVDEERLKQFAQPKDDYALKSELPKKTSDLNNDSGFITAGDIPTPPEVPVKSVFGRTGNVTAQKGDYTAEMVGADKEGKAAEEVGKHNTSENAHNDIRVKLSELQADIEAFLNIDDEEFDQLSELIQAIKNNAGSIEQLTNGKVNVSDIVNNLTTNVANKPLSAAQGVVLKGLVDSLNTLASGAKTTADEAKTAAQGAGITAIEAKNLASDASQTAGNASDKVDGLEQRMNDGEFDGKDGVSIVSVEQTTTSTADGGENVVTVTLSNGVKSIFVFKNGGKGSTGAAGNGIKSAVLNADYTLTLTFDNGAKYTTPSIRGAQGPKGDTYELTETDKEEIANLTNAFVLSIPNTVYCTVGNEFRMYFKNICSREDILFWFGTSSGLTLKKYADYLSVTATTTGSKSLNYKIYSKAYDLLGSGSISFVISENVANNSKILVIGDSTVTQGNAIVTQIYNRYADAGYGAVLLGTCGTAPYLHEGRAGWTAEKYCNSASSSASGTSLINPFYNNGFDFSYYMAQQGYDSVGAVVIQLGINDIFPMTLENYNPAATLGYLNTMVQSIKAYDSTVKVVLSLILPPNSDGTTFTESYNTTQIDWAYRYNTIRFARDMMQYFANTSGVYFAANNCVLDTDTDINDGVHPTATGYVKLGNAIYDTLANIGVADSGAIIEELWDMATRTAQENTYKPATTAGTFSNAHYYYPAAYTGALSNNASQKVSDVAVGANTLQFKVAQGAYGIFVPFIGLDSTKTYRFTVNPTVAGFRVYRVDYDSTGVYKTNKIIVDKTTGVTTHDFTPTAGYQQGFCFAALSATTNVLGVFTDLSLVEVT